MGRSQQSQVNTEGTNLLNTETGNANTAINTALPGYQSILANPGYTDAQKTSITNATEGGVGAAYGSASEGAANRAARTNNDAGLTSTQDALARQRMITSGNLAAQNETNFANDAQQRQMQALGGVSGLYGSTLGGANNTLGTLAGNAKTPGFWDTFGNALAGSLGSVSGSFGSGGASGGFG